MVKIALDQAIGYKRAKQLESMGFEVVCVAKHGEADNDWMNRAFAEGAFFVVSPDVDIPKCIERNGYPMVWIDYPCDHPELKFNLVNYIRQRIESKIALFKNVEHL